MSINVNTVLLISCKTSHQSKRLQVHLNEKSRFDFPEDAPPEEENWVEPFEFLENPDGIKSLDDQTLLVEFYPEETDFSEEARVLIHTLIRIVEVESIIYCELGESWTSFVSFTKEKEQLLWEVEELDDPEDNEKYNSFLNDEEKESFDQILSDDDDNQAVEKVMLKLSNKLSVK